jgi:uncharacterized membrane protein
MSGFFFFLAVILAGIIYFRVDAQKSRLDQADRKIRDMSNQIAALQEGLQVLRRKFGLSEPASASLPEEPKPFVATAAAPPIVAREIVQPPPVVHADPPRKPVYTPPADVPRAPPPKGKSLEESLTSRWLVWLGALTIGLSGVFLVRYAMDHGMLGPAARVTLGLLLGIVLAFAGEWLRRRPLQRAIAAVRTNQVPPSLTAAGLFTAFASIYAAYALYNLLPPIAAFVGLALVALIGVGLSLLHGRFVALMGLLGAFVAPALIDTSNPSAWTLFFYLLVIEAACLAVARYRAWWGFAFAILAGALVWPFLWMFDSHWSVNDGLPLGLYLLLSVTAFFAMRQGAPESEGQKDWLTEIQHMPKSEWVVWIAACAVAVAMFFVVDATDDSATGLVFAGLTAALYLAVGRRHAIFDSLPVVAAVLVLAIAATMHVPETVILRSHLYDAPMVPAELHYFGITCIVFGVLFAIFGFAALWGAKRPALWAGVSASVPIALLVIAYYRIADFGVDFAWAGLALLLAVVNLFAAERVERYRAARGLEITLAAYAAAVVALLSLAAAMSMREAWLTVALSIQLPMLAWINTRIRATSLQAIASIIVFTVLTRLVFNYNILTYPLSANPATSWVIYGYGIPAFCFLWAARIFRPLNAVRLIALLEAGGFAFCVLLISLEIRLFIAGSIDAPSYGLLEQSLQSISWLCVGSVFALRYRQSGHLVSFYGAGVLLGLATAQILLSQLVSSNPLATGEAVGNYPVLNVLLLAYAAPAAFAFYFAILLGKTKFAQFAQPVAGAGFVLLFAYVTLEVTRAFEGPVFHWGHAGNAELYTYSLVWLAYALALLALGIVYGKSLLCYASLAVLIATVLKVFLLDMSDLVGLYRVASFLGLGLSLIGIGYIYQRFVFQAESRTT